MLLKQEGTAFFSATSCNFFLFCTGGIIFVYLSPPCVFSVQAVQKPIVIISFKPKIDTRMANKVNVTPLHDRVIVKPAAAEEKTAGGIIIPDTAKEKPQRGTVIAAGPGKKDEPVTVKEGDTVLYGKYAGTEISIEGEDFLIMRESDILAIV
jgi:chaperonin GroES